MRSVSSSTMQMSHRSFPALSSYISQLKFPLPLPFLKCAAGFTREPKNCGIPLLTHRALKELWDNEDEVFPSFLPSEDRKPPLTMEHTKQRAGNSRGQV